MFFSITYDNVNSSEQNYDSFADLIQFNWPISIGMISTFQREIEYVTN